MALLTSLSKVRKLRRERKRSVSTAVSSAGQTMTKPEKSSDLSESAVTVRLESDSCRQTVKCVFSVICSAVTHRPKVRGARCATV